jgi:hypothetical protein
LSVARTDKNLGPDFLEETEEGDARGEGGLRVLPG